MALKTVACIAQCDRCNGEQVLEGEIADMSKAENAAIEAGWALLSLRTSPGCQDRPPIALWLCAICDNAVRDQLISYGGPKLTGNR